MTQTVTASAETEIPVKTRRKLIEVALPLEKINAASAREKSIRHGHPSTLHLWWARRPLATARAVIFSQMVDDPSEYVDELLADPTTRQKAEHELSSRRAAWLEKRAHQDQAAASGDVQDPDPGPEPTLAACAADLERERLFELIEQLVVWQNTTNEPLLETARVELRRSWRRTCNDNGNHPRAMELFDPDHLPAFHDPFAGGGALPLEAQRLGLEAYASDLNPVAVLINEAMIEIPPKFAGRPPVNPAAYSGRTLMPSEWYGVHGLADDIRHYGKWVRDQAEERIGHLYPRVEVSPEMVRDRPDLGAHLGKRLTVIAWIWARTVKSPNPAFARVDVPLVSTFLLSTKPGKEVYVEPVIDGDAYRFRVKLGKPNDIEAAKNGTRAGKAQDFLCLLSGVPVPRSYIRDEGKAGRLGERLMAIVADGAAGRVYLSPSDLQETVARQASQDPALDAARTTFLSGLTPTRAMITGGVCSAYGLTTWGHLFTDRQLAALLAFSDLVQVVRGQVLRDAVGRGPDDGVRLRDGGIGPTAYADAVSVYLAFALDKVADRGSSLGRWDPPPTQSGIINTFSRQALPMTWDFAEANPLGDASGNYNSAVELVAKALLAGSSKRPGFATQEDAGTQSLSIDKVVSADPPYYDNIGYADLSDFFYVWLRRSLKDTFPRLFATLAVPKAEELVATPFRHGGRQNAESFFVDGMTKAMGRLAEQAHPAYPVTIYYAYKQSETESGSAKASTGWETFLEAVIRAGFAVSGTWPMRTELSNRMIGFGTNALASSIILVCRKRTAGAPVATRREFITALQVELPKAMADLQRGNVAPVDLQMAAIGPGMAVYTRYEKVLDAEGERLSVGQALGDIFKNLDQILTEQEGDFDPDSRWALAWYEQFGFATGNYGIAETLSKAKNTSVGGMVEAGIVASKGGDVRLLRPSELDPKWDPSTDERRPAWQAVHQLLQAAERGEAALADLIAKLGPEAEIARELAYRLYVLSERKKRTEEALWYNGLVQSWPEAIRLAREVGVASPQQQQLFGTQ